VTTISAWLRSSIGTWIFLTISVTLAAGLYTFLETTSQQTSNRDSIIAAGSVLLVILISARLVGPIEDQVFYWKMPKTLGWSSALPDLLRSSEGLRSAFRVLNIEGHTDFQFADPVGRTNLLLHSYSSGDNDSLMGEVLPRLGADPVAVVSMSRNGNENLILVTFARDLSLEAIDGARRVASRIDTRSSLTAIPRKDARDLIRLANEFQLASLAAAPA
jgi:hypothetical protein